MTGSMTARTRSTRSKSSRAPSCRIGGEAFHTSASARNASSVAEDSEKGFGSAFTRGAYQRGTGLLLELPLEAVVHVGLTLLHPVRGALDRIPLDGPLPLHRPFFGARRPAFEPRVPLGVRGRVRG